MNTTRRTRRALALGVVAGLVAVPLLPGAAYASTETVTAPGLLAAPAVIGPDDQSFPVTPLKTVNLSWSTVAGASGYKVQVGTDDSWSDTPVLSLTTANNRLTLPTMLPHGTYVWRVAALAGTKVGHWSSEVGQAHADAQFVRGWRPGPNVVSPAGGDTVDAFAPFSWTPVAGASSYEVQVSTSTLFPTASSSNTSDSSPSATEQSQASEFTDVCYTSHTTVTLMHKVATAETDGPGPCVFDLEDGHKAVALYWRVRGLDRPADTVADTSTKSVSDAQMSSLPQSEIDKEKLSNCPKHDANSYCTPTHVVEYGTWSDITPFTVRTPDQTATNNGFDPAAVLDQSEQVSYNSVASSPDNDCVVDTPAGGYAEHAVCTDFPTLSWDPVAGATGYRITVGLDDQMSNIAAVYETGYPSWTPPEAWRDGTGRESFYYVAQACDDSGCGAYTTTPQSFSKKSKAITRLSAPANTGPASFSWSSLASTIATGSNEAYAYHVQVTTADDPYYESPLLDDTVDATTYYPMAALGDGKLIWHVQAINGSAHKLAWSTSGAFTRDSTAPKVVSAAPNNRITTKSNVLVTFSEEVTGITSGTLRALINGAVAPVAVSVAADGQHATLVPSKPWVPGGTYALSVSPSITDLVGNAALAAAPSFTVNPIVDNTNAAITYSAGWTKLASSNAYGGSYTQSAAAGRSLTMPFNGPAVAVVGCLGPNSGYADISVGSVKKRVSLYRSYSGCGVKLASLTGLGAGVHTVKVVVLGQHVSKSKGNNVGIDFLTAGA